MKFPSIKVLILNTPCNGFGDVMFAWKLAKILRYYYGVQVSIATTMAKQLEGLGESKKYILELNNCAKCELKKQQTQCRRYYKLGVFKNGKKVDTSKFDIFLDAPIMSDYSPDIKNIHKMIPTATMNNTYFFSEYNDRLAKKFDFNMGVGNNRCGLLLLPPALMKIESKSTISNLLSVKKFGPFVMSYIAKIKNANMCIKGFLQLICEKYKSKRKLQIIVPKFLENFLIRNSSTIFNNFSEIHFKDSNKSVFFNEGEGVLTIRSDVYPVSNSVMLGLIKYSQKDILLTGDQSITDALSCCKSKNIFYQIAPWKSNFGRNLSKLMPNKYLSSIRTSCGTIKAINYKSNYNKFVKDNSFITNTRKDWNEIFKLTK